MVKMNKRIKSAINVSSVETIFQCPICRASMKVVETKSLICSNRHTFDFTKHGSINLARQSPKNKYSKELFEARRKLMVEDGFFDPLNERISERIIEQFAVKEEAIRIIDMGCGEGSHLSTICNLVRANCKQPITGIGIDLSKEGIISAAKNDDDNIWLVADLANAPFKDQQFDVILNLLSPANYREFARLLPADGIVIKVVPQSDYLKELRGALFNEPEKQQYSNHQTVKRFQKHFQDVSCSRLQYTVTLGTSSLRSLIEMTPLTWAASEKQIRSFLENDSFQVTVDLEILMAKRWVDKS